MSERVMLREYVVKRTNGSAWSRVGVFMAASAKDARKQAGEDVDLAGRLYRAYLANADGR